MLSEFFQLTTIPANHLTGSYDIRLVFLSYFVATFASYIALDITGRLRDVDNTPLSTTLWLLGGAFAMGAGIWSMHFIGMLAFSMSMPIYYEPFYIGLSMIVAVLASAFALFLLKAKIIRIYRLAIGGVILGFAIASMHYVGMAAMETNMIIHYVPSIFALSIVIAVVASEAALWLALRSNQGVLRSRIRLKLASALIMGAAICGMHYTGMAAAVFTPIESMQHTMSSFSPELLSILIALVTFLILGVAFTVSTYKEISNYQTMKLAHQSGMAEVAANVLHNVGNVLNSVNVSATRVKECFNKSELSGLTELNVLLNEHKDNMSEFVSSENGSKLPDYVTILSSTWEKDSDFIKKEMDKLINNIQHIKNIISMQQSMSVTHHMEQVAILDDMLDEALIIASVDFRKTNIVVDKQYEKIKPILVDKIKLMQIFINLIRNGKHALLEAKDDNKKLIIRTSINRNKVIIDITDNGVGIPPENLSKIFTHGFTTKKSGHGFGLHSSAIAAKEMGGSLQVETNGSEKGATFKLEIPYKIHTGSLENKPLFSNREGTEHVES